jgi:hypothetical protein
MRNKNLYKYLLAGGAAYLLYFLFFRKKKAQLLEEQAITTEAGSTSATYPDSQFYAWANRLENAMFDIGTDEDAIVSIISSLRNNADFLKLKQAFGTREYTGGFLPGFVSPDLTLDGWIQQELDGSDINELNTILSRKGITYRF